MRATGEQEGRAEPGTQQRSGNEGLNPQGESKQARKLGETGTPQLSPRPSGRLGPSCALHRPLPPTDTPPIPRPRLELGIPR